MSNVTRILSAIQQGDRNAAEQLLPLVYEELRRLAGRRLAREAPGQTLDATALVHEAYIRLVGDDPGRAWNSRGHFFAAAAEAMRRILVDAARRKGALRHGGGLARRELADAAPAAPRPSEDLLALDEALRDFEAREPEKAQLVKLRYFAGLTSERPPRPWESPWLRVVGIFACLALVHRPVKLSRRMFVLNAAPRDSSSTAWSWKPDGPWQDGLDDQRTTVWYLPRAPLSDEDLRIHAYLSERLAVLHRERHGRLFFGNRLKQ